MTWCESQMGVDYIFGLVQNSRLIGMDRTTQSLETMFKIDEELAEFAGELINNSIWYKSLDYKTRESWSRSRRVVFKVEYGVKETNLRFVVTSLSTNKVPPSQLYRQKYCHQRGEMENRFKEQQLELSSDRISTHTFAGNQLGLWFSSIA